MKFNFSSMLRRYGQPYIALVDGEDAWDSEGVYIPPVPEQIPHFGVIQPIDAKLLQQEGGRYTMDDRILYTATNHQNGQIILYQGNRYTIDTSAPRDYVDVQKYTMKRVSIHDPLSAN